MLHSATVPSAQWVVQLKACLQTGLPRVQGYSVSGRRYCNLQEVAAALCGCRDLIRIEPELRPGALIV